MNWRDRRMLLGAIALLALVLLVFVAAPSPTHLKGSTYSHAPTGYGAWYAYLQDHNISVQRWEKPPNDLIYPSSENAPLKSSSEANTGLIRTSTESSPVTLVQIYGDFAFPLWDMYHDWVEQGNILVQVGVRTPVTRSPFQSILPSAVGDITIETSRRFTQNIPFSAGSSEAITRHLSDDYGTLVWQEDFGKGHILFVNTPYFAANAYQDAPGNFAYLADLVAAPGYPVWVDEYLHGYKDQETLDTEYSRNFWVYLAQTPLLLLAVQVVIGVLVLIWGQNQRLGPALKLTPPPIANSLAYTQALAQVLRKAGCLAFVVDTIRHAEHLTVQRSLGLGNTLLPPDVVIEAWVQQTGRPAQDLAAVLKVPRSAPSWNEADLLTWVGKIQAVRQSLPKS